MLNEFNNSLINLSHQLKHADRPYLEDSDMRIHYCERLPKKIASIAKTLNLNEGMTLVNV